MYKSDSNTTIIHNVGLSLNMPKQLKFGPSLCPTFIPAWHACMQITLLPEADCNMSLNGTPPHLASTPQYICFSAYQADVNFVLRALLNKKVCELKSPFQCISSTFKITKLS